MQLCHGQCPFLSVTAGAPADLLQTLAKRYIAQLPPIYEFPCTARELYSAADLVPAAIAHVCSITIA